MQEVFVPGNTVYCLDFVKGYSLDEILTKAFINEMTFVTTQGDFCILRNSAGNTLHVPVRAVYPDKKYLFANLMLFIQSEISERELRIIEAENALRDSEQKLRSLYAYMKQEQKENPVDGSYFISEPEVN